LDLLKDRRRNKLTFGKLKHQKWKTTETRSLEEVSTLLASQDEEKAQLEHLKDELNNLKREIARLVTMPENTAPGGPSQSNRVSCTSTPVFQPPIPPSCIIPLFQSTPKICREPIASSFIAGEGDTLADQIARVSLKNTAVNLRRSLSSESVSTPIRNAGRTSVDFQDVLQEIGNVKLRRSTHLRSPGGTPVKQKQSNYPKKTVDGCIEEEDPNDLIARVLLEKFGGKMETSENSMPCSRDMSFVDSF
jgi:hypothetical protein